MIAFVSGSTSRAAIPLDRRFRGLILDSDQRLDLARESLPAYFLHSNDVEQVDCRDESDLLVKLEAAWQASRTVVLALIALDCINDEDIRREAAECAEALLASDLNREKLKNRMYSALLPDSFDLSSVTTLLKESHAPILLEIVEELVTLQPNVGNCVAAWDEVSSTLFAEDNEAELLVKERLIALGAFYRFASGGSDNDILFRVLADPVLATHSARMRELFARWMTKYKVSPRVVWESRGRSTAQEAEEAMRPGQVSGYEAFLRVTKQKAQIKDDLASGQRDRALQRIEQLIADQRQTGAREHLAKSLCDLAMFSKQRGDTELELTLSLRATEEAPDDAWSFVQLGTARREAHEFIGALEAFERAEVLGSRRPALVGKAETLKALGQMSEAMNLLKQCAEEFPGDEVCRNSEAAVLAYFGKFDESLEIYNQLAANPMAGAYTFGGRSDVLHELNRPEEALEDCDRAIGLADSEDAIPYCAKVDILRQLGLFDVASYELAKVPQRHADNPQIGMARARLLRDKGDYAASLEILDAIRRRFPRDIGCRIAIADNYQRSGQSSKSLEEYESIKLDFPKSSIARNSIAAAYVGAGKFEECLVLLPSLAPISRADWKSQYLRGMALMRMGQLAESRELFTSGADRCPWVMERTQFAVSLATLEIREARYQQAIRTLRKRAGNPESVKLVAAVRMQAYAGMGSHREAMREMESARGAANVVLARFFNACAHAVGQAANDRSFLTSESLFETSWAAQVALAA